MKKTYGSIPKEKLKMADHKDRDAMERWLEAFPLPPAHELEKQKQETEPDTKKTAKTKQRVPDQIDLHGFTREEAALRLRGFIRNSVRRGLRKVLVIHGRGLNSPGAAVLPAMVHSELEQNPYVLDFGAATPTDGGAGAMQVFLQRDKRWKRL
jgi:DNA-nicking Smr family endonuclease